MNIPPSWGGLVAHKILETTTAQSQNFLFPLRAWAFYWDWDLDLGLSISYSIFFNLKGLDGTIIQE